MDPFSFKSVLIHYARGLGWAIVASIGFSIGIGIALKIFDWISVDIDEWEEIKKGNIGVSLIFVTLILVVGALVYKVI